MEFSVSDELMRACRHAATIARFKYMGYERSLIAEAASETATVTFINIKDKTYAVTARHVIETFDGLAARRQAL